MARKNYCVKTKNYLFRPLEKEEALILLDSSDREAKTVLGPVVEKAADLEEEEYFWSCLWEIKGKKTGENKGYFHFDGPVENYEEKVEFLLEDREAVKEILPEVLNVLFYGDHGIYYVLCEPKDEEYAQFLETQGFEHVDGHSWLQRPKTENQMLAIGMCLGLCLGSAFSAAFKSYATGLSFGMCLGVAFGALMDNKMKKLWAEVKANRKV